MLPLNFAHPITAIRQCQQEDPTTQNVAKWQLCEYRYGLHDLKTMVLKPIRCKRHFKSKVLFYITFAPSSNVAKQPVLRRRVFVCSLSQQAHRSYAVCPACVGCASGHVCVDAIENAQTTHAIE